MWWYFLKEVNLYIDESGNLGTGMGRYFLICALEVDTGKSAISKRAGRVINRFKKKYGIPKTKEVKGAKLGNAEREELLDSILFKGVKVRYIVLDKKQATMLLSHADDKNACYNYLVQLIVKGVIKDNLDVKKISLFLDNRSVKVGNRLSLKPYLYNKLVMEQLEKDKNVKRIDFEINYFESNSCYLIQWADIVANSLYKVYGSDNRNFYKKIKKNIIFESKFPSRKFGK